MTNTHDQRQTGTERKEEKALAGTLYKPNGSSAA